MSNIRSVAKPRTRWNDVVQKDALQILDEEVGANDQGMEKKNGGQDPEGAVETYTNVTILSSRSLCPWV